VGFIALVADGRGPKSIEFEHEIFFAHFLAGGLASTIMESTDNAGRAALSKAALDVDAAGEVARHLVRVGVGVEELVVRLSDLAGGRHPRSVQVRRNCGAVAAAAIRGSADVPSGLRFRSMSLMGEDLSNCRLASPAFDDVQFSRVDLRGTIIEAGSMKGTRFVEPLVDPTSTQLDLRGLDWRQDLVGLRVSDQHGGIRTVYDPSEIAQVLGGVAMREGTEDVLVRRFRVSDERIGVVSRLCHAYERLNPIGTRHERYADVFNAACWKEVRDALIATGLISEATRQTSGPAQQFYRKHFQPSELMSALVREPNDPSIDDFWARLEDESVGR
jgi:hypothetical protein